MFSECRHFNELFNELMKAAILMNHSRLEHINAKLFFNEFLTNNNEDAKLNSVNSRKETD